MPVSSKFSVAQWAAYLLPVAKVVFLGQLDLKDGLLKDIVESGIDLLGDDAKEKLTAFLKTKPYAVRDVLDQHLVRHTGAVLGRMVRRYAEEQTMEKYRLLLMEVAEEVPAAWSKYHSSEEAGIQTLRGELFTQLALGVLVPDAPAPQHDTAAIIAFFRWAAVEQNMLGPLMPGLTPAMAEWIAQNLSRQLLIELCEDTQEANAAWKESMLRLSVEAHSKLDRLEQKQDFTAAHAFGAHTGVQALQQQGDLILGQLADAIKANSAETRLAVYKRSLLSAFSAYQELALDNYAAAEQAAPDIWDIFVHPACAQSHLRPEEMDAAQMEKPPRLPAADLLPLLAQDDHRRTVLLADPGMGKSTLIQSLIAHLASGRSFTGAASLTGLLPIPLILRDLVPLLPQDHVEGWTWDSFITVLLEHYQREETAPPLCEAYKGHEAEFRQLLHNSDRLFFLIDGLDEIGDLVKRRKVVECIQNGIRAANKGARWLITSRVIGYYDAVVDLISRPNESDRIQIYPPEKLNRQQFEKALNDSERLLFAWQNFGLPGADELDGISRRTVVLDSGENGGQERTAEVVFLVHIAQRLYLAPFDDKRQDAFTSRWFRHRHSTDHSRELMREVRAHHHDGVRTISRVPNLLCMMNMLKRSGKPLPDGRAALYDEIVKAYLGGIDSAYKFKPILGHTCPFETAERRFLLSLLGAHMQHQRTTAAQPTDADNQQTENSEPRTENDSILISVPELQTLLLPAIQAMQQAGKVKSDHSAADLLDELLRHIASRSGLLIPRSSDAEGNTVYGFTHLSFLEFFAAEWLGKEFDRQRNRIVRRAEAAAEGLDLSETDLDREFPPPGPVQHHRAYFEHLPATPAWHEPLIFLLESRKADASTLLRWLFPALHAPLREPRTENSEPRTHLLPLDAVQLAVQLAHDQELALSPEIRRHWWCTLWAAYLAWPHPPWYHVENKRWPIAPLLLGAAVDRAESLRLLAEVYPKPRSDGSQPSAAAPAAPLPPLYLPDCPHLTTTDLRPLTGLVGLKELWLDGCTELEDTSALAGLRQLETLSLSRCTGLKGSAAWHGLTGLVGLKALSLHGCTGLEDTSALAGLRQLKTLYLNGCMGLKGSAAWQGLTRLVGLNWLFLNGCAGLEEAELRELRQRLPEECHIYGPDGKRL